MCHADRLAFLAGVSNQIITLVTLFCWAAPVAPPRARSGPYRSRFEKREKSIFALSLFRNTAPLDGEGPGFVNFHDSKENL